MRILISLLMLAALSGPALAYTPHPGDRVDDLYGWDCVGDRVASLNEFAGHWVFIDFWASWCGPCMGELPNMIKETRPWRNAGKLKIFSVSLDQWDTLDDLHRVIEEQGIDYPVLFEGDGWDTFQAKQWNVRSIPATFLVDPQGNIVATNLRGEALAPALKFFLTQTAVYPPVGLRTSQTVNADGSLTVRLELSNPRRTPVKVEVDYWHTRYVWAEDDAKHEQRPVDREYIESNPEGPEMTFEVPFTDFCETVYELTIPAVENTQMVNYYASVQLPGTETLMNGEGLWVSTSGNAKLGE